MPQPEEMLALLLTSSPTGCFHPRSSCSSEGSFLTSSCRWQQRLQTAHIWSRSRWCEAQNLSRYHRCHGRNNNFNNWVDGLAETSTEVACVTCWCVLASFLLLSVQKLLSSLNRDLIQADAMVTGPETGRGGRQTGETGRRGRVKRERKTDGQMETQTDRQTDPANTSPPIPPRVLFLPSGEVRRNRKWFVEPVSPHQPVRVHGSLHLRKHRVQPEFCRQDSAPVVVPVPSWSPCGIPV